MPQEFEFGPLEWPIGFHFPSGGKPTKRKPSGPPKKPKPVPPGPLPDLAVPPLYVTVVAFSNWGWDGPTAVAKVALSTQATAKGCTIVNEASTNTAGQYFYGITVAVPAGVPPEPLFTLTTSGTKSFDDGGTPEAYFCGTYSGTAEVHFDHTVSEPDGFGGTVSYDVWVGTWTQTTPDGTTSGTFGPSITSVGGPSPFLPVPIALMNYNNQYLSYPSGGQTVNTGLPCTPVPVGKTFLDPFDVTVQVNLQAGHNTFAPSYPYDPGDMVRTVATYGDRTATWYDNLSNTLPNSKTTTIGDGVVVFTLKNNRWSSVTQDLVPMVYPRSTTIPTLTRYDHFGPFGQPQSPPPADPPGRTLAPWNTSTYGTYPLRVGVSPPLVPFDPLTNPP